MKALVIYDSFFGNTEQIAQAIGAALGAPADVRIERVGDVGLDALAGLELLVVGSPTRGFKPSEGTSAWLKALPGDCLRNVPVAAFDTRIALSDIGSAIGRFIVDKGGYAAKRIAKRLTQVGGRPVAPPEGFYVADSEGPLKDGELERAAEWAKQLLTA